VRNEEERRAANAAAGTGKPFVVITYCPSLCPFQAILKADQPTYCHCGT